MKIILTYLFAFLQIISFSQQRNVKVIVDFKTKTPIDYAYITSNDNKTSFVTNKEGKFILVDDGKAREYLIYKIGYEKMILSRINLLNSDTFLLHENSAQLNEITIVPHALDTLINDNTFFINDYFALPNDNFLLLTSRINQKGFNVLLYKPGRGVLSQKRITDEYNEHLFKDCFRNIHLITNLYSRQIIFFSDTSFGFLAKYSKSKFDSTLGPCALRIDSQVIMKYSPEPTIIARKFVRNPDYLSYTLVSKHLRNAFYTVRYSKRMTEMINSELADYARILENQKLIGAVRPQSEASIENQSRMFFSKIAGPIYAPIFLKNDSIIIFDFQENKMIFLNKNGRILIQTPFNDEQFSSYHDFEILYDDRRQSFYLKTKKFDGTSLRLVNIYTGKFENEIKLQKVFAKNIQIINGKIFYLVKEKGWNDTNYLYQQN